jgi:ADP-heptose:LPS heptosyltransferase
VLVLRALGVGDLLTGVPALRALRRTFPDHELVLACPRALEPLVELAGVADRVTGTDRLDRVDWVGDPPDLAVNLHGKGPQSHRLLRRLRPGRLVAFDCDAAAHTGPAWVAEEHEVRRWCRLVEESLGVATDPGDLHLPAPRAPVVPSGRVLVHPGAAYPSRRWPPERYAEVARWAAGRGHEVVVSGGPEEVALAEAVCVGAGLPPEASLAGRTDLVQLAAQVASARLVVCGDTGVAHLASAFSTPSLLLFGPTPPSRWGPPPGGPHTVIWHGKGPGDPWGADVDPALLRTSVAEVVARAEVMLRENRPGARPENRPRAGRRTTPGFA